MADSTGGQVTQRDVADGTGAAILPGQPVFGALEALVAERGGFFEEMPHHVAAYIPGTAPDGRLVVSFDNLASVNEIPRMPWGYRLIAAQGWSSLGILVKRKDWYRDPGLWSFFERLRDEGFFARHAGVSFYGASMGGFGAATFAAAAPGAVVVAFAPQSTLDRRLVPFETRYRAGRKLGDWTDPRFADAAIGIRAAGRAYVIHDPTVPLDAGHAARLRGPNVIHLSARRMGHKLPPAFQKMKILKPFAIAALEGRLEAPEFYRMLRERRHSQAYLEALLIRARQRGHLDLARRLADSALAQGGNWKIRRQRKAILQARRAARGAAPG